MKKKNGNSKRNGRNGNGGRPTRLTKKLQEALIAAIARGNYYSTACHLVGISYEAFHKWVLKGEEGIEPYIQFVQALKTAEAAVEDRMLQVVLDAPTIDGKNWQAAMTFLERRYPDKWSRKERLDLKHEGKIETSHDYESLRELLKDAEFRDLAGKLLARMGDSTQ